MNKNDEDIVRVESEEPIPEPISVDAGILEVALALAALSALLLFGDTGVFSQGFALLGFIASSGGSVFLYWA